MKAPPPINQNHYPRLFLTLAQGERAGLPIDHSLTLCGDISPKLARATSQTIRRISSGHPLAESGRRSGLWAGLEFELLKAAEQSGTLLSMFQRLADYHQRRRANRRALLNGLIMPVMLLLAALVIPPLPALVSGELPAGQYLWNLLSALMTLGLLILMLVKLPRLMRLTSLTAKPFDHLQVATPLIGPWYLRRQLREYIHTLALLLSAGMPVHQAVPLAIPKTNSEVRRRINVINVALANGASFTEALATIEGLNQQAIAITASSETAGKLDEMLQHYSQLETQLTREQERQFATWLPRVAYLIIAIWTGWQIIADSLPKLG